MNRRSFLLGGGILGVVGAAVGAAVRASQPEGSVTTCKDSHMPHEGFAKQPAYGMGLPDDLRSLVPCKNCGVLFALTPDQAAGTFGIAATGAAKR